MRSRRHAGIIPFASTGGTIDGVTLTLFKVETPSDPRAGAPLCHPANEPAAALLSLEVMTSLLSARQQTPSMAPSHAILSRENSKQEGGEGKVRKRVVNAVSGISMRSLSKPQVRAHSSLLSTRCNVFLYKLSCHLIALLFFHPPIWTVLVAPTECGRGCYTQLACTASAMSATG